MGSERRPPLAHDRRVLVLALLGGAPALLLALVLLWATPHQTKTRWTLAIVAGGVWLGAALALRERVVRPLQTLSNMLAGLREGDYSVRARGASTDDPLGLALFEVNTLSRQLAEQRLGALEATALLKRVMEEIDVAVFAFDDACALALVNRPGAALLGRPAEWLHGRHAHAIGLGDALEGAAPRVVERAFPGGAGRWEIRRSAFRQEGRPHTLLVLADLSRALHEEERQAWQRLIRVLSHEINNSLAPVKSIAGSLRAALDRAPDEAPAPEFRDALAVVEGRAESLSRFMAAYARLTRLPPPQPAPLDVADLVRRVAGLERRVTVDVHAGPAVTLAGDRDQLEQLLINLVRNAADAALETQGAVQVSWALDDEGCTVRVQDDGPGLANTPNLFVPFFTTKPHGSGIGLALSRQIAEAHGGSLTLANRNGARGCVAELRLPGAVSGNGG